MAQQVKVLLVDDIDGGEAQETVSFALDNVAYEIDLSQDNAKKLRDSLTEWIQPARKVTAKRARGRSSDVKKIRVWARENGFEVPERGRIASEIREAYEAAH